MERGGGDREREGEIYLANSSFRRRMSSSAVHCADNEVNPQISANKMLKQEKSSEMINLISGDAALLSTRVTDPGGVDPDPDDLTFEKLPGSGFSLIFSNL